MGIYLIRHGSAGTRNPTDPSDSARLLDDLGLAQAKLISDWLAEEPVSRILSSPFVRCTQTVAPLAEALTLSIETRDCLAETSDVDPAWNLVGSLAAESVANRTDVVVCSHGDVIPDLIRRAQLRGMRIYGKSGCSKGSVWTLDGWDGDRFESGSYTVVRL